FFSSTRRHTTWPRDWSSDVCSSDLDERRDATKTRGITAFIVTKDTTDLEEARRVGVGHDASLPKCRGVSAAKKEDKLGWRASDTRELVFQDAIVPKEDVLGPVNDGFRQFLHTLDG